MQERHQNREQYFRELAITSRHYFIPYVKHFMKISDQTTVLEIGCGDGGNLLPFAEKGCQVVGVDISKNRIHQAKEFFKMRNLSATLIASDIFELHTLEKKFDLIMIHDVIEHIGDKEGFMNNIKRYLSPDGVIFTAFPAWEMPFGGHQQICRGKVCSHLPFIHLLPNLLYKSLLKVCGEKEDTISELMNIKETRTSVEMFHHIAKKSSYKIIDETFYFINPHYEVKFGLHPRKLYKPIGYVPYVRDFFTTSAFYLLAV
jgi:ubiquinone/menaquinone biosynthesis C-methylase UbiE